MTPLPPLTVGGRGDRVRAELAERDCPALLVTDLVHVRWLTGFTGSAGRVLVLPDQVVLVTDGRYGERAAAELAAAGSDAVVVVASRRDEQDDEIARRVRPLERLGFEAAHLTYAEHERLVGALAVPLVPTSGVVEAPRRAKDPAELARIERAAALADAALADVADLLAEGPSERAFRDALDARMRELGADGPSFDTIIAAGGNAARPHHDPGERRAGSGETVVVDFGALVDGYHSDMTRTFVVGEPSPVQDEVYAVVLEAQEAGVAAVRPGITSAELDAVCRDRIEAAGFGPWFTHGTGHGVGLRIHEAPWITRSHDDVLAVGDVVTVEPGVYRGDFGGVRIEDLLVVLDDGCRCLTQTPKDSPCLPSRRTT